MIAVGVMRSIWRYIVTVLNVWGCVIFALPLLAMYGVLAVMMAVELITFDPLYIAADVIESRKAHPNCKYGVSDSIWMLTHI